MLIQCSSLSRNMSCEPLYSVFTVLFLFLVLGETSFGQVCDSNGLSCLSCTDYQTCSGGFPTGKIISCKSGNVCADVELKKCQMKLNCYALNECIQAGIFPDAVVDSNYFVCLSDGGTGFLKYDFTCQDDRFFDNSVLSCIPRSATSSDIGSTIPLEETSPSSTDSPDSTSPSTSTSPTSPTSTSPTSPTSTSPTSPTSTSPTSPTSTSPTSPTSTSPTSPTSTSPTSPTSTSPTSPTSTSPTSPTSTSPTSPTSTSPTSPTSTSPTSPTSTSSTSPSTSPTSTPPSTQPTTTPSPKFICPGPGIFPSPDNCKMYYRCSTSQKAFIYICPGNSYFNENILKCSMIITAACKEQILKNSTSTLPPITTTITPRPTTTLPTTKTTTSPTTTLLTTKTTPSPTTTLPTTKTTPAPTTTLSTTKTTSNPSTMLPTTPSPPSFSCPMPGTFQNPSNCKTYYRCSTSGKVFLYVCPGATYFNEITKRCSLTITARCKSLIQG